MIARRRGQGLGRDRALQAALQDKKVLLITAVREVVVGGRRTPPGGGARDLGTSVEEVHQGGQGADQGADGPGRPHDEDMTPREMYKMLKDARADIMLRAASRSSSR